MLVLESRFSNLCQNLVFGSNPSPRLAVILIEATKLVSFLVYFNITNKLNRFQFRLFKILVLVFQCFQTLVKLFVPNESARVGEKIVRGE